MSDTCTWTQDDWGGDSQWETSCGHAFEFHDGGPAENDIKYCGYCGKPLVEVLTSTSQQEKDDDA